MPDNKTITIEKEKLQKLLKNFYRVCSMCEECGIQEYKELDDSLQKMIEWTKSEFGRKLK